MEITEVRVSLREGGNRKLKAYATMTFDNAFVVRNVKIIEGNKGLFVAMPSRKLRESCPKCNFKNAIRSRFCNQCGATLPMTERRPQAEGDQAQQSEHRDVAHPITLECREYIQKKIVEAYEAENGKGQGARPQQEPRKQQQAAPRPPSATEAPKAPQAPQAPQTEDHISEEDIIEGGDIEL
ncbi:MAG: septation protein SpoVG family protein [Candidatus Omnitrophota bacterium]